jgi:hypothetical protein
VPFIISLGFQREIEQREDQDRWMERNGPLGRSGEGQKVEIDIRRILDQMGMEKDRWPQEWREMIGTEREDPVRAVRE